MILGVTNQELLQHNANRSYPLSEQATKQCGDFVIPNSFLVAARITVTATPDKVDISGFYISRLIVYSGGVSITISHGNKEVGFVMAANSNKYNVSFPVTELGSFYGLKGHVTIGTFDQIKNNLGTWTFDLNAGRLDSDIIIYSPAAVSSITVGNKTIYGDVKFVAGTNINIEPEPNNNVTKITFSVDGDEMESRFSGIKTINGVSPNNEGNIILTTETSCLTFGEEASSITINENCCDPCCDCNQLDDLQTKIADLVQATADIRLYQQKLEQQLTSLATAWSGTGLGSSVVPLGLKSNKQTTTSIELEWNRVAGAINYEYQYRAASATSWSNAIGAPAAKATIAGLTASTVYECQVRSLSTTTTSDWSGSLFVSTKQPMPTALTKGEIIVTPKVSAKFTWTAPQGVSVASYVFQLRRSGVGAAWSTWRNNLTSTTVTIEDPFNPLIKDMTYDFRVAAVDTNGILSDWTVLPNIKISATS